MARKPNNPFSFLPTPDVIRWKLNETLTIADRLKLLLNLSEQVYQEGNPTASANFTSTTTRAKPHATR
jgi:hypothetical protein